MEDKIVKDQIKKTMIKIKGALNLLDNGKIILARNKFLGVYQKLGHILSQLDEKETKSSSGEKMVKYGDSPVESNQD